MEENTQKQINYNNDLAQQKAKNIFNISEDNIKNQSSFNDLNLNKEDKKNRKKKYKRKKKVEPIPLQITNIARPIWLSVSEAAKFGGVQDKTIRRAIQSKIITYKVVNNRYAIELASLIKFLYSKTKLKNKLNHYGLGQYITKWNN